MWSVSSAWPHPTLPAPGHPSLDCIAPLGWPLGGIIFKMTLGWLLSKGPLFGPKELLCWWPSSSLLFCSARPSETLSNFSQRAPGTNTVSSKLHGCQAITAATLESLYCVLPASHLDQNTMLSRTVLTVCLFHFPAPCIWPSRGLERVLTEFIFRVCMDGPKPFLRSVVAVLGFCRWFLAEIKAAKVPFLDSVFISRV